jgi:surfeit locus 1 family protein
MTAEGHALGPQPVPVRRLLLPGLSTLAMLIILIGLGVWQVQRLHWKLGLLDEIARAEANPAVSLPQNPSQFAKVKVEGHLRNDLESLYGAQGREIRGEGVMGGQLIVPLERPGQDTIMVDRGWVPSAAFGKTPGPDGVTTVEGYVREADHPHFFSLTDDPAHRLFYTLDPQAIGAALGLAHVAPYTLVAMGAQPAEGAPEPAKALPSLPNNHLVYAITWFGLAATLLVIFASYATKLLRGTL